MTDTEQAAIVCAGGMGSSVAAARSLGRKGVPVVAIAFDASHPLTKSKYVTESHVVTSSRKNYAQFRDSLAAVASQEHVSTLVPMNEYDIYTIVRYPEAFTDLSLPIVNWDSFETVWDRKALLNVAADVGIPTPETTLLSEWNEWSAPTVVKSRYSIIETENNLAYPGVEFVGTDESLDIARVEREMCHEPLIQRYIDNGTEFGFFAVANEGEPIVTFQHRRVRSTNYFGGASAHRVAADEERLNILGRRLLRELNWTGPAMVEFRRNDSTGEFKLMEVNPRFWGSLALGIAAGVDFPWIYYQLSQGSVAECGGDYDQTTRASYLRAELQYVQSLLFDSYPAYVEKPDVIPSIAAQIASLPGSSFDMASLDDPLPFVWDVIYSSRQLLNAD